MGLDVDCIGVEGRGVDGRGVDGIAVDGGVDGFGVDGIGVDGIGVDGSGVDCIGVDGIAVDGRGVDCFGVLCFGLGFVQEGGDGLGLDVVGFGGFGLDRVGLRAPIGRRLVGSAVQGRPARVDPLLEDGDPLLQREGGEDACPRDVEKVEQAVGGGPLGRLGVGAACDRDGNEPSADVVDGVDGQGRGGRRTDPAVRRLPAFGSLPPLWSGGPPSSTTLVASDRPGRGAYGRRPFQATRRSIGGASSGTGTASVHGSGPLR